MVVALMVVAVVAVLVGSIVWRQEGWIADLERQRDLTALRSLARSGTDWARAVLLEDAQRTTFDYLGEPWATKVPPTEVGDGEIGGYLDEQQGRWNLNNLVRDGKTDPKGVETFQRLLERLGLPTGLAFALGDWIDSDGDAAGSDGAEDAYYLSLATPRRAANTFLTQVDELRSVRGFTPEIVEKLRPFVTALPEYAPVNVNTAPRQVLAALLPGVSDGDLDTLLSRRDNLPFRDLAEFRAALPRSAATLDEDRLTTASRYFMANIEARRGDSSLGLVCLIRRVAGRADIVWQRYL